jgi:hypothetical protein
MTSPAVPGGSTLHRPEDLIRDAHVILANCGVPMGTQRVTRLVRQFQSRVERNGFAFFDFLANSVQLDSATRRRALADPDIQRVISYADPTGEQAVNNVRRGTRG